ncbi:2-dehydro-3-deoxygalactonokinase [Glutamicibacter creatinolyticus]|uniref:2-dehydro-3-deoxygalactonokinase n=1 Tax=Glutamicibacter creatinolyticus TaxID=162496 RepID=UPI0031E38FC7
MRDIAEAQLIALDWGTTSVRVYLIDRDAQIVAERRDSLGIMQVAARAREHGIQLETAFEQTLGQLCRDWMETYPRIPIIACGMVGSQQGWTEAAYRSVPADLASPEFELTTVHTSSGRRLHIIPGVADLKELPDVMRGEETQVLGAMEISGIPSDSELEQMFLLPGTHSKWVTVRGRIITKFSTSMTGETFALLSSHSILSRLIEPTPTVNWDAFERGVHVSLKTDGATEIMLTAFSARTLVLTGRLQPIDAGDYLSGLMIGAEIRSIMGAPNAGEMLPLTICGNHELSMRYTRALRIFGIADVTELQDTAPKGIWAVANSSGLLQIPAV